MIRAVSRALAIFDAYDDQHLSLSLQEIAERIRMPKTTAFRLVNTLEQAGFLVRLDNQQYCMSLKLVRLGGLVRSTLNIHEIARPIMLDVNQKTSETVTLNAAVGSDRIVLAVVDTPAPLMSITRPGQRMEMLYGAADRILLAYMAPEELERVLKINLQNHPGEFDRAALDRELKLFRRHGYALTRGQRVPGLTAIAVPIFDINHEVRYSLALTWPSVRVNAHDQELADIMVAAGRDISTRLGASPESTNDLKLIATEAQRRQQETRSSEGKAVARKTAATKQPGAKRPAARRDRPAEPRPPRKPAAA